MLSSAEVLGECRAKKEAARGGKACQRAAAAATAPALRREGLAVGQATTEAAVCGCQTWDTAIACSGNPEQPADGAAAGSGRTHAGHASGGGRGRAAVRLAAGPWHTFRPWPLQAGRKAVRAGSVAGRQRRRGGERTAAALRPLAAGATAPSARARAPALVLPAAGEEGASTVSLLLPPTSLPPGMGRPARTSWATRGGPQCQTWWRTAKGGSGAGVGDHAWRGPSCTNLETSSSNWAVGGAGGVGEAPMRSFAR